MKSFTDRRLPSLQVLRGIAASLVVFHHCSLAQHQVGAQSSWIYNSGLWRVGASGVDIFFVISGFIMVYTNTRKSGLHDSVKFLRRRATRIYPVYWIFTTVLLLEWLSGITMKELHFPPLYIVFSYLLYPTFNGRNYEPLLSQGWTLSFELLFYVVFSFSVALGIRRTRLPLLGAVFILLSLMGHVLPEQSGIRHLLTDPLIIEFLMGVALGEFFLRLSDPVRRNLARYVPIPSILVGSFCLLCTVRLGELGLMRFVYFGVPSLLIVVGACFLGSKTAPRLFVFLGDASYSIYLAHSFFLAFFHTLLKHSFISSRAIDLVIFLAAALIIGASSSIYLAIERPIIKYLSFHSQTPQRDALASTGSSGIHIDVNAAARK